MSLTTAWTQLMMANCDGVTPWSRKNNVWNLPHAPPPIEETKLSVLAKVDLDKHCALPPLRFMGDIIVDLRFLRGTMQFDETSIIFQFTSLHFCHISTTQQMFPRNSGEVKHFRLKYVQSPGVYCLSSLSCLRRVDLWTNWIFWERTFISFLSTLRQRHKIMIPGIRLTEPRMYTIRALIRS